MRHILVRLAAVAVCTPVVVVLASSNAGAAELYTKTFSWHIKKGTARLLPEFDCPRYTPWFKSNGVSGTTPGVPGQYYEADMKVDASDGVGFKGFTGIKQDQVQVRTSARSGTTLDPRVFPQFKFASYATGWYKGDLTRNSIWAPVFQDGTFRLTVTCTSDRTDAAFTTRFGFRSDVLPW